MSITVMSFNTQSCHNFLTHKIDFQIFADTIARSGADIIGLNEIRGQGSDPGYQAQAKILAEKLGFHYYFAKAIDVGTKGPYGNALLSRYPIVKAETILIPDPSPKKYTGPYETRCLLKAQVYTPEGILNLLVSHFGLLPDEHENAVAAALSQVEQSRFVMMGDFNMTPDNPILAPLFNALQDSAVHFPAPRLSFPSDEPTIKIDYLFTSSDVKVLSADIPDWVVSDHRPHLAVIE